MAKAKDKKRKPDYDEKEIPKVLKGPVEAPVEDKPESIVDIGAQPLRARPDYMENPVGPQATMVKEIPMQDLGKNKPPVLKDYDGPEGCPCQDLPQGDSEEVSEETVMPGDEGMLTVLICPSCNNEGPFKMTPPPGISMEARTLKCAKCHTKIPFNKLIKTASGRYVVAGSNDIKSLISHIKGFLKVGNILTWDIINDINVSLDTICKKFEGINKKDKD